MSVFQGTIHQGDSIFGNTAGKQCTAIAAVACCALLKDGVSGCCSSVIDDWVKAGDRLYIESLNLLKHSPAHGFLMPYELFSIAPLSNPVHFSVKSDDEYVGLWYNCPSFGVPLLPALWDVLTKYKAAILVTNDYSIALYVSPQKEIWVFDSHSRGANGLVDPDGSAVLLKVGTVLKAFEHIENLYCKENRVYNLVPIVLLECDENNSISEIDFKNFENISISEVDYEDFGVTQPRLYSDVVLNNSNEECRQLKEKPVWLWYTDCCSSPPMAITCSFNDCKPQSLEVGECNDLESVVDDSSEMNSLQSLENSNKCSDEEQTHLDESWLKQQHQVGKEKNLAFYNLLSCNLDSTAQPVQKSIRSDCSRRLGKADKKRLKKEKKRVAVREYRQDDNYREREIIKNRLAMAERRKGNDEFKADENSLRSERLADSRRRKVSFQEAESARLQSLRADSGYAQRKTVSRQKGMASLRANNPEYVEREAVSRRQGMASLRATNPDYVEKEAASRRSDMQRRRQSTGYVVRERQMQRSRDRANRAREGQRELRTQRNSYLHQREVFFDRIKHGPTHICSCCGQLWFLKSVLIAEEQFWNAKNILENWKDVCVAPRQNIEKYTLCGTCRSYLIGKKQVPPLALVNGLQLPDIPEELQGLSEIEERLVSPRLLFMKIRLLGVDRQYGLRGNCVNVPVDINNSVTVLPRQAEDNNTVFVQIMRRMSEQRPYAFADVRPNVVFRAARYLTQQPLYQKHNIALDERWLEEFMEVMLSQHGSQEERVELPLCCNAADSCNEILEVEGDDPMEVCSEGSFELTSQQLSDWEAIVAMEAEMAAHEPPLSGLDVDSDASSHSTRGDQAVEQQSSHVLSPDLWDERTEEDRRFEEQQESLLDDIHILDPSRGIRIAPGENQIPMSVLFDEDIEELSFPSIYCGRKREVQGHVTMAQIAKSEARMYDRRCSMNITKMFLTFCRLRRNKLAGRLSIAIRKKAMRGNVSVRDMLNQSYVNDLVQHNDGYRILEVDRASPAFWDGKKKVIFAMVRQFGVPTLFLTFSVGEKRLTALIVILKCNVDNEVVSEEEAAALSSDEKNRLVQADPYTVARYANERFCHMWKLFTTEGEGNPFHPYTVSHYYIRLEFQHRGSVHFHLIVWLDGAPVYDPANPQSEAECVQFLDKYITCRMDPELGELMNVQFHRHTPSCRKQLRGQRTCRFGIPFPPMRQTCFLHPLGDGEATEQERKELRCQYTAVQARVNTLASDRAMQGMTFDEFLADIGKSEDEYLRIVRSLLKRPKPFLRRDVCEARLNAYIKELLVINDGNVDSQFITDAYATGAYVADYVTKSLRGVTEAIREVAQEMRQGNATLREQLRAISNVFINKSEVSAQEVAFHNLSIPLSRCSEADVYINTSPSDERVRLLKTQHELENLLTQDPDSCDVFAVGLIDHYVQRPDELEDCCLADWAAWFKFSKGRRAPRSGAAQPRAGQQGAADPADIDDDAEGEGDDQDDVELEAPQGRSVFQLRNKSGYVTKRRKPKVIRYRNYSAAKDLDNFMREQVMLFTSWRDEETLASNARTLYTDNADTVKENRARYVKADLDFEEILEQLRRENPEEEDDDIEVRAPNLAIYELEEGVAADIAQDVGPDLGPVNPPPAERFLLPRMQSQEDYLADLAKLNEKQRQYHDNFIHVLKTDPQRQMLHFVSGGAGVGKSMLINVLSQSVMRVHQQVYGGHPEDLAVVRMAFTGRAAFLIQGVTLHGGLHLFNQTLDAPLNADTLNTLRAELLRVRLFIIDEISMVGRQLFAAVNSRLQQIFCSQEVMGGVSMMVMGDFNQLAPVLDKWVFQTADDDLSVLAGAHEWQSFKFYELTEIMRQRDDAVFAHALNRLAQGRTTPEDDALFKSRELRNLTARGVQVPDDAIHLFRSNAEIDHFNTMYLNSLQTESCTVRAFDYCEGSGPDARKRAALERARTLPLKDTQNLLWELVCKLTARYSLTINTRVPDGMTNGASGTLQKIVYGRTATGERTPLRLYLQFEQENVGPETRAEHRETIAKDGANPGWTPITRVSKGFVTSRGCLFKVERKQFPLRPAKGNSFHKSQGSTYQSVVVHSQRLPSGRYRALDRRSQYVGYSRVTSLDGLFLDGEYRRPAPPSPSDEVQREMNRLRLPENQLSFTLQFPELSRRSDSIIAMFHNIRSLHKYHGFVLTDCSYLAADVLMLCETRTLPQDDILLPGYLVMHRRDCEGGKRHPYGTVLYIRESLAPYVSVLFSESILKHQGSHIQAFVDITCFVVVDLNGDMTSVTFLHRSPHCSYTLFEQQLSKVFALLSKKNITKIIIFGDFNMNVLKERDLFKVDQIMSPHHSLKLCIDLSVCSTDNRTLIDLCYSNIPGVQGIMHESMISDHKPLWSHVPWNGIA